MLCIFTLTSNQIAKPVQLFARARSQARGLNVAPIVHVELLGARAQLCWLSKQPDSLFVVLCSSNFAVTLSVSRANMEQNFRMLN